MTYSLEPIPSMPPVKHERISPEKAKLDAPIMPVTKQPSNIVKHVKPVTRVGIRSRSEGNVAAGDVHRAPHLAVLITVPGDVGKQHPPVPDHRVTVPPEQHLEPDGGRQDVPVVGAELEVPAEGGSDGVGDGLGSAEQSIPSCVLIAPKFKTVLESRTPIVLRKTEYLEDRSMAAKMDSLERMLRRLEEKVDAVGRKQDSM